MKGKEYGANSIAGKAQDRLDKLKGNGKSQSAKNIEYRNEVEKDVENGFTRGVTKTKTKR